MIRVLGVVAVAISLGACSTVIRGTKDTAEFQSYPEGATVTATRITENDDNPVSCVAPCKLELSRKRDFNISFALDGHKPVSAKLSSRVSGDGSAGFLGNALLGGPIGAAVDAGTGAAQDLTPIPMIAHLAPTDSEDVSKVVDKDGEPAPGPEFLDESSAVAEGAGDD